jgi:diacylglycerol kinase (ATP)
MLILVNERSCGGKASVKWQIFVKLNKLEGCTIIKAGDVNCDEKILHALSAGETDYVAAGGDGTVNFFINKLIALVNESGLNQIRLGAVGLGSSNDFHKPYNNAPMTGEIPYKLNFRNAELRDVGMLTYQNKDGELSTKYFLINASIGVTAEGNHLFNYPDAVLGYLKRMNTSSAIIYSAFKTIFTYNNMTAEIKINSCTPKRINITNLNIIKNPNVSGNLNYGYAPVYNNGKFNIHLAHDMNKFELIQLFLRLQKGNTHNIYKLDSWQAGEVQIKCDNEFKLEFDGEVITTNSAFFSVKKELLNVCKN